jgi:YggT family protein
MTTTVGIIDLVRMGVSYLFLGATAVAGLGCLGDWLVRTRRLSPFGATARFFRKTVDPLLAPVERRIVRAGGMPTAAPLWALLGVVILGVVIIVLLNVLRGAIVSLTLALAGGARPTLVLLAAWAIGLLQLALIVRVIESWISIAPGSRLVRWARALTEWMLRPLRSWIRPIGNIDITPMVAYLALWVVQALVF